MNPRATLAATLLAAALSTSCSFFTDANGEGIAGDYVLASGDGQPLPCCAQTDSTGNRVTIVSGTLRLGPAASEKFVVTPAGFYPASCVFEVPNGSTVDTSKEPRCGDGDFTLTLTQRLDAPDGSTRTMTTITSGKYAWSDRDPSWVKLVDASMDGPVARNGGETRIALQRVRPQGEFGVTYAFVAQRG